jgi:hypothetical protein
MSKDLDIGQIKTVGRSLLLKLQRSASFIFILVVLCVYGFLIFKISTLLQAEPSEDAISEQSTVKRLKIDQNSINKIKELEDQNVGVQSLFESARDNPFQD